MATKFLSTTTCLIWQPESSYGDYLPNMTFGFLIWQAVALLMALLIPPSKDSEERDKVNQRLWRVLGGGELVDVVRDCDDS